MNSRWLSLFALVLLGGSAKSQTTEVIIATNSTWRYFKGTTEASVPTNLWRELSFDHSSWLTASAPFHYTNTSTRIDLPDLDARQCFVRVQRLP